jgi:Domain of Unknown Function (DUF1543)
MTLHFLILGCKPAARHTEQHDVFFGVGNSLKELVPQIENFWPDAGKIHIDSWRMVTQVDGFNISVVPKRISLPALKLFFLNLGGYKPNDLEEYHYNILTVAADKAEAITKAKHSAFFKHKVFSAHIDDKYGVDVDDVHEIEDILPASVKEQFSILIEPAPDAIEDELQIGYLKLSSL